jgi:hypothetical protein
VIVLSDYSKKYIDTYQQYNQYTADHGNILYPNDFVAIVSHTPKIVKISLSRIGDPIKKQKAIIA